MGNYLSSHEFNINGWTVFEDNEDEPRHISYRKDGHLNIYVTITQNILGYYRVEIKQGFHTKSKSFGNLRDLSEYLSLNISK